MTTVALLALLGLPWVQAQDPVIELEAAEFAVGEHVFQVEIGRLAVPENRSDPDANAIELGVAVLRSTSEEPGAPLVFLAGGPGNSATSLVRSPTWARFLELGDVILMDQRGVGESRPELVWESEAVQPALLFNDRDTAFAHMYEIGELAATHYAEAGVDLSGYHTIESADDVDDLRLALGEERISLMGHSYGTHLGLAILRRHGDSVERFVSIGSAGLGDMHKLPSELDQSLRELAALVEADPLWKERFPDFYGAVEAVLDDLEQEPLELSVVDRRSGRSADVLLGRFGLQMVLLADLGDTSDLPAFPLLIASLEERDPRLAAWFVQKRYGSFAALPVFTLLCRGASGATEARWEQIEDEAETSPFGSTRTLFSPVIDEALGTPNLGDAFRQPVQSDVPTLFISGSLDAHTPPHQAERIRQGLSHSGHVILEYGGHEDILRDPQVHERILDFLAGGEPEDEVLAGTPLRFLPPGATRGHPAIEGR